MKKSLMLAVLGVLLASLTVQGVLACTTRTPGYWKTHHPDSRHPDWPTTGTVTVGCDEYDLEDSADVAALLAILKSSAAGGDKWITLAQKVIAAQLSIMRYPPQQPNNWAEPGLFGMYPGGMVGMVDDANVMLCAEPSYLPGTPGRDAVVDLAETMDYWLNYWNEHGL